ncbi:sensor histidine kinase [Oceanobacillus sp. CAU 1775]
MYPNKYELFKVDHKWFAILPTLLILWLLLLPFISLPFYETINHYLQLSLESNHAGKLIVAAFILIIVFTVSEMAIFLLSFSIGRVVYQRKNIWLSFVVTALIIFISFAFLTITMDYRANFSTPFIITVIYMIILFGQKIYEVKFRYQALLLFQLLFLVQWLEISPAMHNFGFGKSDTALRIVEASYTLEMSHLMQIICLLMALPFLFSVFVTFTLIKVNTLRIQELEKSRQREGELQHMRLDAIESRTTEEMQNLVHDLKTPLTTISGLTSLIDMSVNDKKGKEYTERIERAVEQLNTMISEILSEDVRKPVELSQLLNYTRAHLVEEQLKSKLEFINHHPNDIIYVNRIRVARLLVNLIENALHATEHKADGKVLIELEYTRAYSQGEKVDGVKIYVRDNGYGIAPEKIDRIWNVKYSLKGSSGLGLPFVRKVVKLHGGWIKAESIFGEGTVFTLFLPYGSD